MSQGHRQIKHSHISEELTKRQIKYPHAEESNSAEMMLELPGNTRNSDRSVDSASVAEFESNPSILASPSRANW